MHNFLARNLPLDLLVNNAGTAIMPDDTTEDGFEVWPSPAACCELQTLLVVGQATLLLHSLPLLCAQAAVSYVAFTGS